MFDHDSLAIMEFGESLNYDIRLLRDSPAVPKHIKPHDLFYEISSGTLTEVVRDIPAQPAAPSDDFDGLATGRIASVVLVSR